MNNAISGQLDRVPHPRWREWPLIIVGLPMWLLCVAIAVFFTWPIFVFQAIRGQWPPKR